MIWLLSLKSLLTVHIINVSLASHLQPQLHHPCFQHLLVTRDSVINLTASVAALTWLHFLTYIPLSLTSTWGLIITKSWSHCWTYIFTLTSVRNVVRALVTVRKRKVLTRRACTGYIATWKNIEKNDLSGSPDLQGETEREISMITWVQESTQIPQPSFLDSSFT